jgi:hypothetical protein
MGAIPWRMSYDRSIRSLSVLSIFTSRGRDNLPSLRGNLMMRSRNRNERIASEKENVMPDCQVFQTQLTELRNLVQDLRNDLRTPGLDHHEVIAILQGIGELNQQISHIQAELDDCLHPSEYTVRIWPILVADGLSPEGQPSLLLISIPNK